MRKRLKKKLNIDYDISVSELRDPIKRDKLRRAAKAWLIGDINKSILYVVRPETIEVVR